MKRRNFLRDIAFGVAASLVPKILQPMDVTGAGKVTPAYDITGETAHRWIETYSKEFTWHFYRYENGVYTKI